MTSVIDQLPFFRDKDQAFVFKVVPMMRTRKLYQGDILYSQGDIADEVIFVLNGSFSLYIDISDKIELPDKLIDRETNAFNVPFSLYRQGSYFGDEDVLVDIDLQDLDNDTNKVYRNCTVEANEDAEIMTIKKRHLMEPLSRFIHIRRYMMLIAKEKLNYHNILIESILERYKDVSQRKKLIDLRMQEQYITLHMSLKRTLRKNKEMKRIRQMQQRRGDGFIDEEEETKAKEPPMDIMKLKTQAVLNSYTMKMRSEITE